MSKLKSESRVAASSCKLNVRTDLRWVANFRKFHRKHTDKSQETHLGLGALSRAAESFLHWLISCFDNGELT